jgi:biotin carboxyl carrier protein
MKYNITVGEKTYEVEIEDINKRPVIARVDGEVFQVLVERRETPPAAQGAAPADLTAKKVAVASAPSSAESASNGLVSPLPGTVVEIFVKPGEEVESGQVVLIIEAMKMKNSIRAVRGGVVKRVLVNAGQTVAHKQALLEFEA